MSSTPSVPQPAKVVNRRETRKRDNRCCVCGRFYAWENLQCDSFTPDTAFTSEQIDLICTVCKEKERASDLRAKQSWADSAYRQLEAGQ